jgi:putative ABC transport system permease protein
MMTGRRRTELNTLTDCLVYSGLTALGFAWLENIFYIASGESLGESLTIAFAGAGLGELLTFPVADWFGAKMGTLFPVFEVSTETVWLQFACALVVGVAAAVVPAWRAARVRIVEGLRAVG